MLASGSRDRTVNIWNVKDGTKIRPLGGFALAVSDVAFSEDRLSFAASSLDGTTRVWELKSGKMLNQIGLADKKRLEGDLYTTRLIFDPTQPILWLGWANGAIQSWNWSEKDAVPKSAGKLSAGLVDLIQHTETQLISLDLQGSLQTWNIQNSGLEPGQPVKKIAGAKAISALTANQILVGSFPATVERLDLSGQTNSLVFKRPNPASQVTNVLFTLDKNLIISGSGDGVRESGMSISTVIRWNGFGTGVRPFRHSYPHQTGNGWPLHLDRA